MMHRLLMPLFMFVLALLPSPASAAPAVDPLPTQSEIKQTFDSGDYPKTLQKLQRVLILKGKAAEPYNRHELLRIKGETQLRIKATSAAAQAFAEASKEAPDGAAAAQDIATELLLKRSGAGLQYQPKAKDPTDKTKPLPPVPVVEPADRKKAIELLYADERAVVEAQVKAITGSTSMTPVLQALPAIRNVRWLEMAANGNDERTKAMVAELAEKTKKRLATALKDLGEQTDDIERGAMEVITARIPINDPQTGKIIRFKTEYRYRGPNPRQMSTLQAVAGDCVKIFGSCDELGGSLGATGKEFNDVKSQAKQVGGKAETMLKHNWRATYPDPPPALAPKKP
jgi:hypothetical protein